MAAPSGRADPPLERSLFEDGHRFDFFQAVRLLERLYPHRQPVGREAAPAAETVRFHAQVSLGFPPSAVHDIDRDTAGGQPQMTVAFIGMTGPLGVLPRHYTEMLVEGARKKDPTLRDFLDLFNHRVVSFFYRAWEKYRFAMAYERTLSREAGDDRFSRYLFDLFGMGTEGLRGRLTVDDRALLLYAGLLAQAPRSASALQGLLSDYFGVPVTVEQFRGQWLPIAESERSVLGPRGRNNVLGVNTVAGRWYWDQQADFSVRVGPLSYAAYGDFLPTGRAFGPLVQLTRFYAGQAFNFDIQLVLEAAEVPRCGLGSHDDGATRLGWSTWLKTDEFTTDADDAVFGGDPTYLGALAD